MIKPNNKNLLDIKFSNLNTSEIFINVNKVYYKNLLVWSRSILDEYGYFRYYQNTFGTFFINPKITTPSLSEGSVPNGLLASFNTEYIEEFVEEIPKIINSYNIDNFWEIFISKMDSGYFYKDYLDSIDNYVQEVIEEPSLSEDSIPNGLLASFNTEYLEEFVEEIPKIINSYNTNNFREIFISEMDSGYFYKDYLDSINNYIQEVIEEPSLSEDSIPNGLLASFNTEYLEEFTEEIPKIINSYNTNNFQEIFGKNKIKIRII